MRCNHFGCFVELKILAYRECYLVFIYLHTMRLSRSRTRARELRSREYLSLLISVSGLQWRSRRVRNELGRVNSAAIRSLFYLFIRALARSRARNSRANANARLRDVIAREHRTHGIADGVQHAGWDRGSRRRAG